MAFKAFDPSRSELQTGINLIEASAGTGKTYAIAMLVLRFVVEQALDIKDLLVVTFTKAATDELKTRIRSRLQEAGKALSHYDAEIDANLKLWLDGLALDTRTIAQRLELALLDIDQAAIYTIHGFCQRVLSEHALESGQMFDCELSGDIDLIRQNCAYDFWRKQLYRRPAWQTALLTADFQTPDQLLYSISGINPQQTVYPDDSDLDYALERLKSLIAIAEQCFQPIVDILEAAFADEMFNDSFRKAFPVKCAALAGWLADPNSELSDFSWLTSSGLQNSLNGRKFLAGKNKPLNSEQQKQHYLGSLNIDCSPFDNLAKALQQLQVVFRCALVQNFRDELDKALQQNNIMSFDDLITRLDQALSDGKGQWLKTELQKRYRAALIDEFQDTDQKQWRIFSGIFDAPKLYLYLIGDPKQAIYKFRGADIFSYFAAQQQANHHYTLLNNWRSHPDLVVGVNRLFKRAEAFLFKNLAFNPVQAARNSGDGQITGCGTQPLVLWQLDKNSGNLEHWSSGKAAAVIRNAVVNEIVELLSKASIVDAKSGGRSLQAKDIAILVRSNNQAVDYQQALNAAGIPAVLNSKQSVFAAPQALELLTVLLAVAQPGHIPALKQALTVSWFNLDGQQLYRLFNDETSLDAWLGRFQDYYRIWRQHGLLSMMQGLLYQEQVEVNLSANIFAERALTNLHHIIERLQQAEIDEHLSINKTLDWLRRAILQSEQDSSDERQLRLESDEDTVKIVTLHSAKGLEYPLVFCPSLWQRSDRLKTEKKLIQCHENGEMIADMGSEQFANRRERALYEELAEDLRLFYVAVTRAKYRCYLCWADVRSKENANDSAMAYLFEFTETGFAGQQQILTALTSEKPLAFQYRLLAADTAITQDRYQTSTACYPLTYRQRHRSLLTYWQMSSYTGLSALSLHDAPELPEDKASEYDPSQTIDNGMSLEEKAIQKADIFDCLPKGAQTGNVVHSLLETISFQSLAAGADISQARIQAMRRYGLNIDTPASIDQLLHTVVSAPLSEDKNFCLKNLPAERCLKEMPFYLSMQQMDTARINRILNSSPAYQVLSSKQMCGYLTGFIDLICEYQGQYYVMDYKTNSLPDYKPESLMQAMRVHNYGLQYWLYSLVLDRYLQQRLPGYAFDLHFGGIKYLFVRGMQVDKPGFGVFSDLPEEEIIRQLAEVFFGEGFS